MERSKHATVFWWRLGLCWLIGALTASIVSIGAEPLPPAPLVDVFTGGQDGYPAYRIPSLIAAPGGWLLAFAEGRSSPKDHAENDIVLKRSSDLGQTWGPLQRVCEDGANALNNPTALVLPGSSRTFLMFQRYPSGFDERKVEPGLSGPRICQTWLMSSDNAGASWSQFKDVTAQVKRPEATSTATGPGIGIQLSRGQKRHTGRRGIVNLIDSALEICDGSPEDDGL